MVPVYAELWTFRKDLVPTHEIVGFEVDSRDGKIGKIDEMTDEVGRAAVVVDTGPWIFGRKVVIPAGTVTQLDLDNEVLGVGLTKDQIKDSPEFKPDTDEYRSQEYRSELGTYYGQYRS